MKEEFDFYNSTSIKSYNLDETIRYQLKMLDGLDVYTRRHSDNVANITCRLCEKLHLDRGFTIYCTTCAYIHDIGKKFLEIDVLGWSYDNNLKEFKKYLADYKKAVKAKANRTNTKYKFCTLQYFHKELVLS